jgi:hypothetical protein
MYLRASRRNSSYTSGVRRSSAWGFPERQSFSSCVKFAGAGIVNLSSSQSNIAHQQGIRRFAKSAQSPFEGILCATSLYRQGMRFRQRKSSNGFS